MTEKNQNKIITARRTSFRTAVLTMLLPGRGLFLTGRKQEALLWMGSISLLLFAQLTFWFVGYGVALGTGFSMQLLSLILWVIMLERTWGPGRRNVAAAIISGTAWVAGQAVITLICFMAARMPSSSMEPNINGDKIVPPRGEQVLGNKLTYHFRVPQRDDIAIFRTDNLPGLSPGQLWIKRVAGLPGETILIQNQALLVNGKPVSEGYYSTNLISTIPVEHTQFHQQVTLGPDEYFVLGDNSANSLDSRTCGPISKKSIIAKATHILHPHNRRRQLK